jgi:hypothetical protein
MAGNGGRCRWTPSVGTMDLFMGVKQHGNEVNCSYQSIAQVKNEWSCQSALAMCLHGMDREILPLHLLGRQNKGEILDTV